MAAEGTPLQGLDYIASKVYVSGALSLVCYTNTAGSLGDATTYASLVQPTGGGYAPITLNGTWTILNGTVTYDHGTPDNPSWTCTGTWSGNVTGVAMVDIAAGKIVHFRDLSSVFVAANLKKLEVDITNIVA